MKTHVFKRYCYRQTHNISSAVAVLAEKREKYPDDNIFIELNERSTWTKYRVVRLSSFEIEVPDAPESECLPYPNAAKLPDEEVEIEITQQNRYSNQSRWIKLTHKPTGTTIEKRLWYDSDVTWYRKQLEQQVDPTFEERKAAYTKSAQADRAIQQEWADGVEGLFRAETIGKEE